MTKSHPRVAQHKRNVLEGGRGGDSHSKQDLEKAMTIQSSLIRNFLPISPLSCLWLLLSVQTRFLHTAKKHGDSKCPLPSLTVFINLGFVSSPSAHRKMTSPSPLQLIKWHFRLKPDWRRGQGCGSNRYPFQAEGDRTSPCPPSLYSFHPHLCSWKWKTFKDRAAGQKDLGFLNHHWEKSFPGEVPSPH